MAKKSDLFTDEREDMTTIGFKAPKSLKDRAEAISKSLEILKPGTKFNVSKILLKEYEDAIVLAEDQLEDMKRQHPPLTGSSLQGGNNSDGNNILPMNNQ